MPQYACVCIEYMQRQMSVRNRKVVYVRWYICVCVLSSWACVLPPIPLCLCVCVFVRVCGLLSYLSLPGPLCSHTLQRASSCHSWHHTGLTNVTEPRGERGRVVKVRPPHSIKPVPGEWGDAPGAVIWRLALLARSTPLQPPSEAPRGKAGVIHSTHNRANIYLKVIGESLVEAWFCNIRWCHWWS